MKAVFPHMMNSIFKAFKKISSTFERHLKSNRTLRGLELLLGRTSDILGGGGGLSLS